MIGKIEKAHRYAREPERVHLDALNATFDGEWHCSCHTFESHAVGDTCAHVMALQDMMKSMLSEDARYFGSVTEPV
jgi:hypothetical protein